MVVDKIENLEKYVSLNPLFAQAVEFLKSTDLNAHEIGKVKLQDNDLVVNFAQARAKTKEEAKLETHNRFIDIQIPLDGVELMGYTPRTDLQRPSTMPKRTLPSIRALPKVISPLSQACLLSSSPKTDTHRVLLPTV